MLRSCFSLPHWSGTKALPSVRSLPGELLFPDTFKDRLIEPLTRPEIGLLEFLGLLFDVDESAFCGLLKNAERVDDFQAARRGLPTGALGRR